MTNYAIVLVTFNRATKLERSLQTLIQQTLPAQKIIVIDNHSTDKTSLVVTRLKQQHPQLIDYHHLNNNRGGAGGFMLGIEFALSLNVDWIALSDDDTLYQLNYFELLLQQQKLQPAIQCLTGSICHMNNNIETNQRRRLTNRFTLAQVDIPALEYQKNFYLDFFSFIGVILKVELIKKIGLPRADFFIWFDDSEYSLRVRQYTKILNVSSAMIYHDSPTTKNSDSISWKTYYGLRNQIATGTQYAPNHLLYSIYIRIFFTRKIVGALIKSHSLSEYRTQYQLYKQSFNDGLAGRLGINKLYHP